MVLGLKNKTLFCLSLLLVVCLAAVVSHAADELKPVGEVVALRGKVVATDSKGTSRKLAIKSPLFQADTIKTGKRGRLQILFTDNSIISLGPNTEAKISQYGWDPDADKAELETEVKEGVFRVMGGLISKKKPEKFNTKTPVATIGIRGSMYAGKISKRGLSVVFEGGKGISLTNATGTVVISKPGYTSQAKSWNAPISKPTRMKPRHLLKMPQHMKTKKVLRKVIRNMKKPPKAVFDDVIKDAIDQGLTVEESKEEVQKLLDDPEVGCK